MGRAQIIFLGLCFFALSLRAEQFGNVDVFLAPNPAHLYTTLDTTDYHVFPVELKNNGLQPAHIILQLNVRNSLNYYSGPISFVQARQSVLLAPGSSRLLTLAVPPLQDTSERTSMTSNYLLTVFINGKAKTYNLGPHGREQSYVHHRGSILMSNSLPQSAFNMIFLYGTYKDQVSLLKMDFPPRQWPGNAEFYFGKKIIFCSSTDEFSDELRLLLQKWVFAGGILVTCLPPDLSWAEKYPHLNKGWDIQPCGWGAEIICQPFNQEHMDKINAFLEQKKTSEFSSFGSSGLADAGVELNPFWQHLEQEVFPAVQEQPFQAGNLLSNFQRYLSLPVPEINIRALLFIMLLFVIVIGPINYYYFHRRKQKLLMLLSTPLLSLVFCLLVVLFINFSEGWEATAQSAAITLLDQNHGLATTKAICGIYSPTTIRDDFQFTAQDRLVFSNIKNLQLLDKPGQVFSPSLVRPRIPVYYAVSRTENRQERLNLREVPEGLEVINGLGGPLDQLVVHWPGNLCYLSTTPIAPGEKIILTRKIRCADKPFSPNELAAAAVPILQQPINDNSLQRLSDHLPAGYYAATVAEPLFFTSGHKIRQNSHKQLIIGF